MGTAPLGFLDKMSIHFNILCILTEAPWGAVIAIILQAFRCLIQTYLDYLSPIYVSASKILSTVDHLPPPWNMSVYRLLSNDGE
jgi:hypothetical protein